MGWHLRPSPRRSAVADSPQIAPEIAVRDLFDLARPERVGLVALGFFGGTAHALPESMYVGGLIGPFDILVALYLFRWAVVPPRKISSAELRLCLPFALFGFFGYVGDFVGALTFGANTLPGVLTPLRYFYYPTLFFTLRPFLRTHADLRLLFVAYIGGVLAVCALGLLASNNDVFGVPQLYNPNVLGNFIAYALVAAGFLFMPGGALFKAVTLLPLFAFGMCTFSKATWLLAPLGVYLNLLSSRRVTVPLFLGAIVVSVVLAFTSWGDLYDIVSRTIELKLTVSLNQDQAGGSSYMRLGFFLSSMQTLFEYPFGIGLKNFALYHHTHMRELGGLYTDSESPHQALGFAAVQAGWMGVALFIWIVFRVLSALRNLYTRSSRLAFPIITVMVLVSVFYQIEFITQPFIYLVLAASHALREQASAPAQTI
jgi:hypothetical protein